MTADDGRAVQAPARAPAETLPSAEALPAAEPTPTPNLVMLATDDATVCVDETCLTPEGAE
jgi:alpha-beta hydrolase superfamily lysophospholipase